MKIAWRLVFACLYVICCVVHAQAEEKRELLQEPTILMNGIAHLGNGEVIENSVIAFEDGKITLVGDARVLRLDLSKYEVIEVWGKHVYPGVVHPDRTSNKEKIVASLSTNETGKTIEEGSVADLVVSDYELSEGLDVKLIYAFISGREVGLGDKD